MVTITEKAETVLKEYFKDKEISPIRIFLQSGSCCGPSLAMVLDEAKGSDDVFPINGFTMVIDKDLLVQTRSITVDYADQGARTGFMLVPEVPILTGGGGCGCSSGACHS